MKNAMFAIVLAAIWAAPARAADDSFDSLFQETIKTLDKLSSVLSNVKDRKTADEAKPDFEKAAKSMTDLKKRTEKLGEPSKDQKDEMEKKYKPKMEAAIKALQSGMVRVQKLEGGTDIVQEFAKCLAPLAEKKPIEK